VAQKIAKLRGFLALLESNLNINKFILSDINAELIGIYELIKNNPDKIINTYNKHHKKFNSADIQKRKDYFTEVRNDFNLNKKSEDFYFIMRTTTNGMPRYNRTGLFNNSCHFSRPGMRPDDVSELIKHYNKLFNSNNIQFLTGDYSIFNPNQNDLVYCDPPYEHKRYVFWWF
jgi:DNA adenine methylase